LGSTAALLHGSEQGHRWQQLRPLTAHWESLLNGCHGRNPDRSISKLAIVEGIERMYLGRVLHLTKLAPAEGDC